MKKNIVVIGGGNGAAISINALKKYQNDFNISAVITMSDSGGSSGFFRKEFGVLPTGDIMRAILAMSPYDHTVLKKIFYRNRFKDAGKLDSHNLGNLFLVLSSQYDGNFLNALGALHQALETIGTVHPVTLDSSDFAVRLSDGSVVVGEHKIDRPSYDKNLRITEAWLEPKPQLYAGAQHAIEVADVIIFGPGSLYCSIIAALVVPGVKEIIAKNTDAQLIYVVGNAFERDGETGPKRLGDFIAELEQYLPRQLDQIVFNDHPLLQLELDHYDEKGWELIDYKPARNKDRMIVVGDFEKDIGGLDCDKLAKIFKDIPSKN